MRSRWILNVGLFGALAACSPTASAIVESPTPLNTITFPRTWTPISEPPSTAPPRSESVASRDGTPTQTSTATLTPTSTMQVTPRATSTVGYSAISCTVTALEGGVELLTAPFFSDNRILPTMEPRYVYQAAEIYPTYIRLLRDGQPSGWVDYRLLAIEFNGDDCFEHPPYDGDLTDFDTLCFMRATPVADTYSDRELTEPFMLTVGSEYGFVVMTKLQGAYASCVSHAGPCFYVDADDVEITGSCADVPYAAEAIAEVKLWSQPDGSKGEQIDTLPVGTRLFVQGGSVEGLPAPDASGEGRWLLVKLPRSFEHRSGWLWSGYIEYR